MSMLTDAVPVQHFVYDNFVFPSRDWTVPDHERWECEYNNDCEFRKRTLRDVTGWAAAVLQRMQSTEVLRLCTENFGTTLTPDPISWGGGLQVIAPGGYLNPHLDGVVHPKVSAMRRAVQLVCFCHPEWMPDNGGEFAFFHPNGELAKKIEPLPGRLLAFESCHDLAYHGVLPVADDAPERVSVAVSLLAELRPYDTRMKALFFPRRT